MTECNQFPARIICSNAKLPLTISVYLASSIYELKKATMVRSSCWPPAGITVIFLKRIITTERYCRPRPSGAFNLTIVLFSTLKAVHVINAVHAQVRFGRIDKYARRRKAQQPNAQRRHYSIWRGKTDLCLVAVSVLISAAVNWLKLLFMRKEIECFR